MKFKRLRDTQAGNVMLGELIFQSKTAIRIGTGNYYDEVTNNSVKDADLFPAIVLQRSQDLVKVMSPTGIHFISTTSYVSHFYPRYIGMN